MNFIDYIYIYIYIFYIIHYKILKIYRKFTGEGAVGMAMPEPIVLQKFHKFYYLVKRFKNSRCEVVGCFRGFLLI